MNNNVFVGVDRKERYAFPGFGSVSYAGTFRRNMKERYAFPGFGSVSYADTFRRK